MLFLRVSSRCSGAVGNSLAFLSLTRSILSSSCLLINLFLVYVISSHNYFQLSLRADEFSKKRLSNLIVESSILAIFVSSSLMRVAHSSSNLCSGATPSSL